jgi:hypothetical protein
MSAAARARIGAAKKAWWAKQKACPSCGQLGLVTRKQIAGLQPVICGSEKGSVQFFIREEEIVARRPN